MTVGPFEVPGFYVGDCREMLRQLPDASVQCVVTSPPYWALRDYGVVGQLGLEATPADYVAVMVEVFREVRRVLADDGTLWLNLGDTYATGAGKVGDCPGGGERGAAWSGDPTRLRDSKRGYRGDRLANGRGDNPAVLRRKTRASRDGTHAGKNTAIAALGPMQQPNRLPIDGLKAKDMVGIPWRVAFALQADGWYLRSDIIWHKPNPMPESAQDRPTRAHEYLFLLSKKAKYFYAAERISVPVLHPAYSTASDASRAFSRRRAEALADRKQPPAKLDGDAPATRNARSVWTVATQPVSDAHFATFPEKLVEPCILAGSRPGDVVLDPFFGSGTVGRVAEKHGRLWLGFDLSEEYAKIAARRTAQRSLPGTAVR